MRSSEPRDKVYALREVFPALSHIEVDYSQSPEEVFRLATVAIIKGTESLGILIHACRTSDYPARPSWVVDWSTMDTDTNYGGLRETDLMNSTSAYHFSANERSLFIHGKTTATVGMNISHRTPGWRLADVILRGREEPDYMNVDDYPPIAEYMMVLREFLISCYKSNNFSTSQIAQGLFRLVRMVVRVDFQKTSYIRWLNILTTGKIDETEPDDEEIRRRLLETEVNFTPSQQVGAEIIRGWRGDSWLWTRLIHTTGSQSFFMTSKGHMGISSFGFRAGDWVVHVSGLAHSLIVRPVDGAFVVIGPAGIGGLMDEIDRPRIASDDALEWMELV